MSERFFKCPICNTYLESHGCVQGYENKSCSLGHYEYHGMGSYACEIVVAGQSFIMDDMVDSRPLDLAIEAAKQK